MKLFSQNLIEGKTITASTEVSGSGVAKLTTRQIGDPFLFGVTGGNVVIDMGTSTNVKNLFMGGINGSWTLQANATNVWTAPTYSASVTKDGTTGYLVLNQTFRYWRLLTTTDTGIGLLTFCNTSLQLPGVEQGSEIFYGTTSSRVKSIGGQVYSDSGYQFIETTFNFPQVGESTSVINGVTCASRKNILTFWDAVENIIPFWCMLWENSLTEFAPFLCVLKDNNIQFKKNNYPGYYSTSLSLEEVL